MASWTMIRFFKRWDLVTRDSENLMNLLHHMDLSVGDTITLQSTEGITKEYTVLGIVDFMKDAGSYKEFILSGGGTARIISRF